MSQLTLRSDGNNPTSQSSQNKAQLLEATMRNVPKLKELNYTQWKNVITNSIKNAKLWGYVDGTIEQPPEENNSDLAKYFDEAGAVRNAILGSLEPRAQLYIEEELNPRDAWLMLEKKYLTAEAEADAKQLSIEKQLADLRLEEGGDIVEHIAEFCRMRTHLNGTGFALDEQASISMLYRSSPPSLHPLVMTPDGMEMKDLNALCARLGYFSQNPIPEEPGVPEDIKAFGLTGDKNPLLEERGALTCRDCLLKDHKGGTPDCPQYEWRKELWGTELNETLDAGDLGSKPSESPRPVNARQFSYEYSEPVKVVLDFDELGLKSNLRTYLSSHSYNEPLAIQQCTILSIVNGHNVLAQTPPSNGKTTALEISTLRVVETGFPHVQALVFTSTSETATAFQKDTQNMGSSLSARCYACDSLGPLAGTNLSRLPEINNQHILVGTPDYLGGLIRRNIINLRKLKIMVLDDLDKLIEAGMEDQIIEIYGHAPPVTQVVALTTVHSLDVVKAAPKLLADPIQIWANRNEGGVTWNTFLRFDSGQTETRGSISIVYGTGNHWSHDFL